MKKEPLKLKPEQLPYEVEKDLSALKPNPMLNVVMVFGIILIAIGGFNIIFGPDSLYISYSGPTFGEFLQLYPGPIATVGFLLAAVPNMVASSSQTKFLKEMTESYELDKEGTDIPEEAALIFNIVDDNKIIITLDTMEEEVVEEERETSTEKA